MDIHFLNQFHYLNNANKCAFNLIVFGTFIIDWIAIIILPGIICLFLNHKFVNVGLPFLNIFVPNISSKIQCIKKPSGYLGLGNSLNGMKS
jgi:hypothetical protein